MDDFDADEVVKGMRALSEALSVVFKYLDDALTTITENLHVLSEAYIAQSEDTEEDFEDEDSGIPEPTDDYIKRSDAVFAVQNRIEQIGMGNNPYVCSIRQAVRDAPAADVEPKQRWVPVTDADSLPKKSIPCLVACNQWGGEIVRKATYLDSEKRFFEGAFDITEYVTHWMPSPEPPEMDEEKDNERI